MENNKKIMFSAIFDRYERTNNNFDKNTKVHIRQLSTREGVLIAKNYVFDEEVTSIIPSYYRADDYIAFLADIKLVNVEF
jgi:hypothetical protein